MMFGVAEEMKPYVEKIEKSAPLTRGHYGDYLALLSILSDSGKKNLKLYADCLILAGANEQGVHDAEKLLTN